MHRRRSRGTGLGHVGRQPEVSQDALNHRRVVDERDQLEGSPTPGTSEDIQAQAPAHQLRPEIVASVATVRRFGMAIGGRVRFRSGAEAARGPELDHERPPRRARRQDAVIENQVDAGSRGQRRETLQQFNWVEEQVGGPVCPRASQRKPDLAVAGEPKAFLRHGRTQGVPDDSLQTVTLIGGHAQPSMEIEAVVARLARSEP